MLICPLALSNPHTSVLNRQIKLDEIPSKIKCIYFKLHYIILFHYIAFQVLKVPAARYSYQLFYLLLFFASAFTSVDIIFSFLEPHSVFSEKDFLHEFSFQNMI